jgi:hypothetical protein
LSISQGFGAAGDGDVALPGHDSFGGDRDGLQARGAKAIDGHRRNADGQSRAQRSDSREIHSLLRFRSRAPDNHVFDFFRCEALRSRERFFDHERSQVVRTRRAQSALRRLAHRCPYGAYKDGFSHGSPQTGCGLHRRKLLHWMPAGKKKQPGEDVGLSGGIASA